MPGRGERWTRRNAIQLLGALGGSVIGGHAAYAQRFLSNDAYNRNYGFEGYKEPNRFESQRARLAATIQVRRARNYIGSDLAELRSYDNKLFGPTLRVRPGDILDLRIENHLPVVRHDAHGAAAHHDYNATNIHTHGLHVSPLSPADNVLLTILPFGSSADAAGPLTVIGSYDYKFEIPRKHLPGTHWYHSHLHGSTAIQLASGMAGALIVLGDIDEVPEIKAANERVFMFQQIPYADINNSGVHVVEDDKLENLVDRFNGNAIEGDVQPPRRRFTTLNGGVPVVRLNRGAVERWRMVHAGIFEPLEIDVVACDGDFNTEAERIVEFCGTLVDAQPSDGVLLYPIARDGISVGSLEEHGLRALPKLGPGNRMDVLVKAVRRGTYILRKKPEAAATVLNTVARFQTNLRQGLSIKNAADAVRDDPYALAIIVVSADEQNMRLPTLAAMQALQRPRAFTPGELAMPVSQHVDFRLKFSFPGGNEGLVNGKTFDTNQFPRTLRLGDVEKWEVKGLGSDPHPFHIHVNPFQLVENESGPVSSPLWLDTYMIAGAGDTPSDSRSIQVMTRYEDFVGKFVLHCHNLIHEDQGMMQLVEILPRPKGPLELLTYYRSDPPVVAQPFYDSAGSPVMLGDFKGRVVLLCLWQAADAGADDELRALDALNRRLVDAGFAVLPVSQGDSAATVQAYYATHELTTLPVFLDPQKSLTDAVRQGGEITLPRTIIVDQLGHLRGFLDKSAGWNSPEFEDLLTYFRRV